MATPRAADAPSSATTPASRTRAAGLKFTAAQTSEPLLRQCGGSRLQHGVHHGPAALFDGVAPPAPAALTGPNGETGIQRSEFRVVQHLQHPFQHHDHAVGRWPRKPQKTLVRCLQRP